MTPRPLALDEFAVRAFAYFVEDCHESGHSMCDGVGECERALESARDRLDFDLRARQFDLFRVGVAPSAEPPAHTWSTSALFRVVTERLLDEPPWSRSAHRRMVWLTSALSRLGERGIPADAIVRTCFGGRIRRQMIIEIVSAYLAIERGEVTPEEIPPVLREWITVVPQGRDLDGLLQQCLAAGPMSESIDDWIENSALTHVIGWRRNAERVEIAPEDRVVLGGVEATRWLVDRFTRTALDEWSHSSLDWELAYLSEEQATARAVGVAAALISERPVSESMVIRAIARRTREQSLHDEVFGGMTPEELMNNVIALTMRDERSAALELVRKAVEFSPSRLEFAQALAFLLIPECPGDAERRLVSMRGRRGAVEGLITACLAMCRIRCGRADEVVSELRELSTGEDDRPFWLWTPESLTEVAPTLERTTLGEWAAGVLARLSR